LAAVRQNTPSTLREYKKRVKHSNASLPLANGAGCKAVCVVDNGHYDSAILLEAALEQARQRV
jgi:hypothetical protein